MQDTIVIVPKCVFQYTVWMAREIRKKYLKIIPRQQCVAIEVLTRCWGSEE